MLQIVLVIFVLVSVPIMLAVMVSLLHGFVRVWLARRKTMSLRDSLITGDSADEIRLLVLAGVVRMWSLISLRSWVSILWQCLRLSLGITRIETLYVVEYTASDCLRLECTGAVRNAWLQDADGLRKVEPLSMHAGALMGKFWQRGLIRFAILPDKRSVIENTLFGPEVTAFRRYRIVEEGFWPKWCSWRHPKLTLRTVETKCLEGVSPPWHIEV